MSQDTILEVTITAERFNEPSSGCLVVDFGGLTKSRDREVRKLLADELGIEGNGDTIALIGRVLHAYIGSKLVPSPSYSRPDSIVFSVKDGWRSNQVARHARDFLDHRLKLVVEIAAPNCSTELGCG